MFAVIKTGGKQYKVAAQDVIRVESLAGEAGDQVAFDVLLLGDGDATHVGAPLLEGASVTGEIVEQTRARKVIAFKKRRRQNYRRTRGHRQHLTVVRITDILAEAGQPRPMLRRRAERTEAEPVEPNSESGTE
jgi:large subunit ribosomal protein L21